MGRVGDSSTVTMLLSKLTAQVRPPIRKGLISDNVHWGYMMTSTPAGLLMMELVGNFRMGVWDCERGGTGVEESEKKRGWGRKGGCAGKAKPSKSRCFSLQLCPLVQAIFFFILRKRPQGCWLLCMPARIVACWMLVRWMPFLLQRLSKYDTPPKGNL